MPSRALAYHNIIHVLAQVVQIITHIDHVFYCLDESRHDKSHGVDIWLQANDT